MAGVITELRVKEGDMGTKGLVLYVVSSDAAGGAALIAVVFFAPEAVALGALTDDALMVGGTGEYVTLSADVIAQGNAVICNALNSAGVGLSAGGPAAQVVGHTAGHAVGAQ
jgi:hypothetical protein